MAGALYYPNWCLNDPISLGEFLLYWDRLTFMTPVKDWHFPVWSDDSSVERSLKDAHTKYALAYPPSETEKAKCDRIIRDLLNEPKEFEKYTAVIGKRPYQIDARKLAYETVEFLEEHNVLRRYYGDRYIAGEAGGHLVMAVLAHCCSSEGLPAVTTDDRQFTLQMLSIDDSLALEREARPSAVQSTGSAFSMLLKRIRLPKARKRDPRFLSQVLVARQKDDVNGYRTKFQGTMADYCQRLMTVGSPAELDDVLSDFDSSAETDAKKLRKELRSAGVDAVISKNGAIAIATGVALGAASSGAGALAGTLLAWRSYKKARQKVLTEHWTSWLHQIKHPHFSIW